MGCRECLLYAEGQSCQFNPILNEDPIEHRSGQPADAVDVALQPSRQTPGALIAPRDHGDAVFVALLTARRLKCLVSHARCGQGVGTSSKASQWAGRMMLKWARSKVATRVAPRRSAMAIRLASVPPRGRSA